MVTGTRNPEPQNAKGVFEFLHVTTLYSTEIVGVPYLEQSVYASEHGRATTIDVARMSIASNESPLRLPIHKATLNWYFHRVPIEESEERRPRRVRLLVEIVEYDVFVS